MSELDRKSDFEQAYMDAWTAWSPWQAQARDDMKAKTQNAWTPQDIAYMKKVMPAREIMSFPHLRKLVRFVANFERMNRMGVRYEPVEGSDIQTAGQLTTCANDALARGPSYGYHVKSDCFEHMLDTGMSLFNMGMDRNGQIGFDCYHYNQFVLHAGLTRRDLRGCQYGILRKDVTFDDAKMLFPDAVDLIDSLASGKGGQQEDGKFSMRPHTVLYGKHQLVYDEWQRRTTVQKKYWINLQTGWVRDEAGNRFEYHDTPMERMTLAENPLLDVLEDWSRTVRVTQYLNGHEVFDGVDPFGIGDFSFTPFICFLDPSVDDFRYRVQGLLRSVKDAQRTYDRRTIANIRAVECTLGAGTDFEENALVDNDDAYMSGPGRPRFLKEGAIAEGRYRDRPAPNLPGGWMDMQIGFEKEMGKILGLDEDGMFGTGQKDQLLLGVVGKLRMGLGMVGMFDFFDNASLAHQIIGGKLLRLIQRYTPDKVSRILGEPPSQTFFCREFSQYDAVPCETVITDTQRNALYTELVNLKRMGAEIGEPCPIPWSLILEFAPIAMKGKIMQALAQLEQQANQSNERMRQIEEATQQAVIRQLNMDTANEQVHIMERKANAAQKIALTEKTKLETAQIAQEIQIEPTFDAWDRFIKIQEIEAQREAKKNQMVKSNRKNG